MKILVMTDDFPPRAVGGPAIVSSTLSLKMKQRGHDIQIITTVKHRNDVGKYEYEGMTVHALYSHFHPRWRAYLSLHNFQTVPHIKKIIQEFKPDVVHAHNVHSGLSYYSFKLAKKSGARVILTTHDMMLFHYGKLVEYINPEDLSIPQHPNYHVSVWQQIKKYKRWYNPFRNIIIRHYLKFVDHVCAVSNAHKEVLIQNGITKPIEVVYNGINTHVWKPEHARENQKTFTETHNLQNKKTVLYVGRLQESKGAMQLIQAFHEVSKKIPHAVLVIAGKKDSYAEAVEKYADSLGIKDTLHFTGWLDGEGLRQAYNASDVVAFPSICFDTFGMVNIEAMSLEKPVVATCFGGAPEVVSDGVTGTIINPYDTKKFAAALSEFLTNESKSLSFGRAGRERVEKMFTLEKQVKHYEDLYKK